MIALALPSPARRRSWLAPLLERQPLLATFGLFLLLLALMTLLLQWADPRLLDGENVWVKPTKFLASMSLFALTSAWLHGLVAEEKRNTFLLRWNARVLVVTATFELVYIGWAASNGIHSHFNVATPAFALMFNLMGIAALILVGTGLPLALALARYPERDCPRVLIAAGAIGLVLTFALGAISGFAIGSAGGHDIGPRTASLPVFGWSLSGGDLRVAHFLGMHAQQVLPVLGLILAAWHPAAPAFCSPLARLLTRRSPSARLSRPAPACPSRPSCRSQAYVRLRHPHAHPKPAGLLAFHRANGQVVAQVTASPGFVGGSLILDGLRTFWTVTGWADEDAMRAFRNSGAHRIVMPRLITWCDEAATAHWQAPDLPDLAEVEQRLLESPKFFKVARPSHDHWTQRVQPLSRFRLVGPLKARPTTAEALATA